MPVLEVSEALFKRLQQHAVPLVDTVEGIIASALDALDSVNGNARPDARAASPVSGSDLVCHAGRVPHGTKLRMRYKGGEYFAEVSNGKVIWNEREFKSLSAAAVAVMRSVGSGRPTENGWRVWWAQNDAGRWVPLR